MKDRIVNGHQFGKIPRYRSWPKQMELDKISNIYIHWFVTHSNEYVTYESRKISIKTIF